MANSALQLVDFRKASKRIVRTEVGRFEVLDITEVLVNLCI